MAALVKLRTKITENQKEILCKFFDEGMISKGKEKAEYHNKAAQETGLDINVVKEWVGNHAKKLSGRKYTYGSRTAVHSKGVSAYNLYVKEMRDSLGPMSTWAESWNMLSPTEKGEYAERAAVTKDQAVLNPARAIKQMIKEIHSRLEILQQLGLDPSVIGIENGSEVVCGTGLVHSYICQKPEIMQDQRSFLSRGMWHSSWRTVKSSIKRRSKPIFGFVGVAGHKLNFKKVKAGSSQRHKDALHSCC
ncbi:uncharacterized protein LOC127870763 [Dreissena polymorpha]|uniref:uncharacterized protein LOC127870763 n=1 Tax=Dreissena polymorpha TaxID=45954 RepID=UPI002264D8A8|nr:uncharacterized protein LOC127870763 [Dreissena polymorpha]